MSSRERPAAVPEVQFEDGTVRVTRWNFGPGAETGPHRHDFDYVVVPLADGMLAIETANADRDLPPTPVPLSAGRSYGRKAGVEHNVVNATEVDFAFVEIELLDHPG